MHAGLFVQAGSAGEILCVRVEADSAFAAPVKFAKTVVQQGHGDPASPPETLHAQRFDVSRFWVLCYLGKTQRKACDLVAVPRQEPQRWVVVRIVVDPVHPLFMVFLKGTLYIPPVVFESRAIGKDHVL